MATSAHINQSNAAENKRVSFVADEQIHMILYENDASSAVSKRPRPVSRRLSFTEVDAPPSKVKVHTEDSEIPRPISPPAQINNAEEVIVVSPLPGMSISPAFERRIEKNIDNPFRPDEVLYREVNPIIEVYKNRPFPPSSHNSPVPSHQKHPGTATSPSLANISAISNSTSKKHEPLITTFDSTDFAPAKMPNPHINGDNYLSGGAGRSASLAEARREVELSRHTESPPSKLPPPNKAEVVHIEEKKRCAPCCSVQ